MERWPGCEDLDSRVVDTRIHSAGRVVKDASVDGFKTFKLLGCDEALLRKDAVRALEKSFEQ